MTRFLFLALLGGTLGASAETITSPNGSLKAEVKVDGRHLSYTVTLDTMTVVESSALGFTLNGQDAGDQVILGAVAHDDVDETFPSRHGVHASAHNRYHGSRITVTHGPSGTVYVLNVRAYDSGIAFRYELAGDSAKNLTAENTSFVLPAGTMVWSQQGRDVYENIYGGSDIAAIAPGAVMGPPVVGKLPDGKGYLAVTESAPGTGFPNPFLTKSGGGTGRQLVVTYPKNGDNTTGASSGGDLLTPWNVVLAGRTLNKLVNSDIVESLAPAPDPVVFPQGSATAWAQPGRSVWDWMSRFPGGITAENSKLDAYWANQLGWEYLTIDEGWSGWNRGNPWPQIAEVTAYATPLKVKVLLWTHSSELNTKEQRTAFFQKLKAAGASGFKADFFDFHSVSPSAKERVALIDSILKEAAGYQLVADLHGTGKPLGQFRTYPNLLNFEAVYGKEQFPDARATVYAPLTRLLAGPADYTPLGLGGNLRGGQTDAFEIATVVNMAGPLITLAERSDTIAKSPFAPVIKSIPNLWDETRLLPQSEVGESVGMLRRKGSTWYVAIMNANPPKSWPLALDFLTPGMTYQAEIIRDGSSALETRTVTNADMLTATTGASGGFVAKISLPTPTVVDSLPFNISFGTGQGNLYAERGQILSTAAWADRLLEERLPDLLWQITAQSGTAPLTVALDFTDAYQGGSSLKASGDLTAVNDLTLYATKVVLTPATRLGLAFKRGQAGVASGLQVGLVFSDASSTPVFLDAGTSSVAGWNEVGLPLGEYAGRTLAGISLRLSSAVRLPGYRVNIGKLSLYNGPLVAPSAPEKVRMEQTILTGLDSVSGSLKWDPVAGATRYHVYQSDGGGQRIWLGATAGTSYPVSGAQRLSEENSADFEVAAVLADGRISSRASTQVKLPVRPVLKNPLSGTVIGTAGSFQNSGNTREKIYDGDVGTFFDAEATDGAWSGVDLGAGKASRVVAVKYYPRDHWSQRATGGVFQGANQADFGDAVTLATVASQPKEGTYTLVAATGGTQSFRYLRYLSPKGGWGNMAEVVFYGPGKQS